MRIFLSFLAVLLLSVPAQAQQFTRDADNNFGSRNSNSIGGNGGASVNIQQPRSNTLSGNDRANTLSGSSRANTLSGRIRSNTLSGNSGSGSIFLKNFGGGSAPSNANKPVFVNPTNNRGSVPEYSIYSGSGAKSGPANALSNTLDYNQQKIREKMSRLKQQYARNRADRNDEALNIHELPKLQSQFEVDTSALDAVLRNLERAGSQVQQAYASNVQEQQNELQKQQQEKIDEAESGVEGGMGSFDQDAIRNMRPTEQDLNQMCEDQNLNYRKCREMKNDLRNSDWGA